MELNQTAANGTFFSISPAQEQPVKYKVTSDNLRNDVILSQLFLLRVSDSLFDIHLIVLYFQIHQQFVIESLLYQWTMADLKKFNSGTRFEIQRQNMYSTSNSGLSTFAQNKVKRS